MRIRETDAVKGEGSGVKSFSLLDALEKTSGAGTMGAYLSLAPVVMVGSVAYLIVILPACAEKVLCHEL